MPVARVQLEDGRIARFDVPAGTKPREIEQAAAELSQAAASADPQRVVSSAQTALQTAQPSVRNDLLENTLELGFRQVVNNALAIPAATGELLALGGAGAQTAMQSLGDNEQGFGDRFRQNLETQKQQFPASALRAVPRVTVGDIAAGAQAPVAAAGNILEGEPANLGGEFEQARLGQEARVNELRQQPGGTLGPIAGDVATLLMGRAPIARAKAPKMKAQREAAERAFREQAPEIPERIRRQFTDVVSEKILPAFKDVGTATARGGKKAAEAGLETATLAALNDEDPMTGVFLGAGAQAGGSLGLFLATKPVTRLLPTVATAAVLFQMAKETVPGGKDFILESGETSIRKAMAAMALGAAGALTGAGRLRGPAAEQLPILMDAITAIPRGVMQNRLRELADSPDGSAPMRTLEKLSTNPQAFAPNQINALDRALRSEKAGAFTKEVNRLMAESESFRNRLNEE